MLLCNAQTTFCQRGQFGSAESEVLTSKSTKRTAAYAQRWVGVNKLFFAGDVFNLGYLLLQTAVIIFPVIAHPAGMQWTLFGFGAAGCVLNFAIGGLCLKYARESAKSKETRPLAIRLFANGITLLALGLMMGGLSVGSKIHALAPMEAFFKSHHWILPVLFALVPLPIVVELVMRFLEKRNNRAVIQEELQKTTKTPREKMEYLQLTVGVDAALAIFKAAIATEEDKDAARQEADKELKEWDISLYTRAAQQALSVATLILTLVALSHFKGYQNIPLADDLILLVSTGIATYMDACWPFKRNGPLPVDPADEPKAQATDT